MFKKIWKKLTVLLSAGIFVLSLSACQSVEKDAKFIPSQTNVDVVIDLQTGKKQVQVGMTIGNNSIYDVTQCQITYEGYKNDIGGLKYLGEETFVADLFVPHGKIVVVLNYFTLDTEYEVIDKIVIKDCVGVTFSSLWDSYVGWFIATFVLLGFSLLFFGLDVFRRGARASDMKQSLKDHLSNSVVIFLLIMVICLIPLTFSGWVPTLILVGGFLSFVLLSAGLVGIATAVSNK